MSMAATRTAVRGKDHPARSSGAIVGIFVFLCGIALIVYVFILAHGLFDLPPAPLPVALPAGAPGAATAPTPTQVLTQSLTHFLQQLLILFLMCVAGSLVAGQGVNLFFKALAAAPARDHDIGAPVLTERPPEAITTP